MNRNYELIDDGESSYKIEWIGKKPIMNSIENFKKAYKNMDFISTCGRSSQYVEFGRDVKKLFTKLFGDNYTIETNIGHFEVSGFISKNDRYCYFSIGDIRYNDSWYDDILYRTAENNKDFRGGSNRFCSFDTIVDNIKKLLEG